ncbi:sulfite oxidase [Dactylosporangium sp. NPDC005572]|uniref:sulfite oxidase n=1 Tax=Dactylosporangium sp. NPDC005572 TaxID=3156889 RepID=UPI0033B0FB01
MGAWNKRDDMLVHSLEPYNAEPAPAAVAGQPITPLDTFYSRNHGAIPVLDPATWHLAVDGLVDHPLQLSLTDLRNRFEQHTVTATLLCAGNRRAELMAVRDIPGQTPWRSAAISTARWTGARLRDVLDAAGLHPDARHVAFTAADLITTLDPPGPFGGSIPAGKATAGEVLLAWQMNDDPLPAVHGGPVRVVVPGYIGARSIKWVHRITAQQQPSGNHFQTADYRLLPPDADPGTTPPGDGLSLGAAALNAAILTPADGTALTAGTHTVSGYAIPGEHRRIARVDVSADAGRTWQQAVTDPAPGPWAWTLWHTTVDLPPGPAEIAARAWDDAATTQPERPEPLWNPLGYLNTAWSRVHLHTHPARGSRPAGPGRG